MENVLIFICVAFAVYLSISNVVLLIDIIMARRSCKKFDMVEDKMDQIAGPLLTSKVLFPDDEGFYYPEEEEE